MATVTVPAVSVSAVVTALQRYLVSAGGDAVVDDEAMDDLKDHCIGTGLVVYRTPDVVLVVSPTGRYGTACPLAGLSMSEGRRLAVGELVPGAVRFVFTGVWYPATRGLRAFYTENVGGVTPRGMLASVPPPEDVSPEDVAVFTRAAGLAPAPAGVVISPSKHVIITKECVAVVGPRVAIKLTPDIAVERLRVVARRVADPTCACAAAVALLVACPDAYMAMYYLGGGEDDGDLPPTGVAVGVFSKTVRFGGV